MNSFTLYGKSDVFQHQICAVLVVITERKMIFDLNFFAMYIDSEKQIAFRINI
jgi:hypothetical protein